MIIYQKIVTAFTQIKHGMIEELKLGLQYINGDSKLYNYITLFHRTLFSAG